MKISRSTRKKYIISLGGLLVILVIALYFILFKDEVMEESFTVSNGEQASGISLEIVDDPLAEIAQKSTEVIEEKQKESARKEVYGNMTLEELANQINKSLNDDLAGKGYLYASYCLEKGVDPYLAVAISLEETGCTWGCSGLVKSCNNVGGMKGSGCGAYGYFNTLDDGIKAFIDNIARNYVAYGLTTAELMNPKYAENPRWASNVNAYIYRIKNK